METTELKPFTTVRPRAPIFTFVVEVSRAADFPLDMLRYDEAAPATEDDVDMILRLNSGKVDDLDHKVRVTLKTNHSHSPHTKRWESFGCTVVEQDNPYVSTPARKGTEDPDTDRARELKKLSDVVLRHPKSGPHETPTHEALRNAVEVATQDAPWRERAIGFCQGVNRMLKAVSMQYEVEAFCEALNCATLLLGAQTAGEIKSLREQVDLAVAAIQALN